MKENQKLISKFNKTNRLIYIFSLLLFVGISISLLSNYDIKDIKTTSYLIGSVGSLIIAFFILLELYNSPKIIIQSDKIELIRFFKFKTNSIELSDILSWIIREKKNKYGDYEILYLVLNDNKRVKIKSYKYSNFYELKLRITKNKIKNTKLKAYLEARENRNYTIAFILIGTICFFLSIKNYDNKELRQDDISIVKGHLSEPIKIEKSRKSKTLKIKLIEFEEFNFIVGGIALRETYYNDLMRDFKVGQEFQFSIEKTEFEKKILKTMKLSFWDLIFHYEKISIFEINANNFKYLSLKDYNEVHMTNNKWVVGILGLFGLALVIGGIMIKRKEMLI